MGLFTRDQIAKINAVAEKSKEISEFKPSSSTKVRGVNAEIQEMSQKVIEYFHDSPAILIENSDQLHDYVTRMIEVGIGGIDTETTGLDRIKDTIVGASLYYPGGVECYIPMKHLVPIFDEPYKGQLSYMDVEAEFQRFVDAGTKMIFANADFDLAMIYKDIKVDMNSICYYDVILAWRCLKENERDNALKVLYNKYVLKGQGDPMKFTDFFTPQLFPYCKPEVAKLYAANDAKITYELFMWQLPYVTKGHPKCKKHNLEAVSDLLWDVELPLIRVCQNMHRTGIYLDKEIAATLVTKYSTEVKKEEAKLADLVQEVIEKSSYTPSPMQKVPFKKGSEFSATSTMHVKHLLYTVMGLPQGKDGQKTDKTVLAEFNLPVTNQILKVRSLHTLISTFVDKLPKATTPDSRIHCQFRQIGADTGRMCIAEGTPITVLNGTKNIEDIVPGDYVYCYSDGGTMQLAKVLNNWCTGLDRECVDITWQSSGKGDVGHLICTPEHRIRKKSGEWVRADELKRYDKLAHLRRSPGSKPEYRPVLYGWDNAFDYEQHVAKYSIFGRDDDWVLHHINEDPTDNRLENLEPMLRSDHYSHHGRELQKRGVLSPKSLHTPEAEKKAHETLRRNYVESIIARRNELLQMIADVKGRISCIPVDYENFLNQCAIAEIDVEAECRKYNPRYHKPRISKEEFVEVYNQYEGLAVKITEHFQISYDKFYKYCGEYGIARNHMVLSVKPAGKHKVFDIEVEGYHNFIASEINVHNSSADPNMQNIPSHATDIRHMFRATPGYVMISSDYSQQEPKLTAFCSGDEKMISAFQNGRDIYATVAALAFNMPYEKCLEFHPETGEYQPDGKARRGEAKTIVLGINYGRSVVTIADQLFGTNDKMTQDEKVAAAQKVYDSVLNAFPNLRSFMTASAKHVKEFGYTETILGRRRHLPDMQLPEFEFKAMKNYVNPDVDPLDVTTLQDRSSIPERIVRQLEKEFSGYKYFGQIARRTKELYEEGIRVINNRSKINDASRQVVNSIIQGSAAEQTKMAILQLEHNERWREIKGRLLVPVHDELIAEVPIEHWKEGGELLSKCMCDAASFLPFPSKCDVTTTFRWYGVEYPCPYKKPESFVDLESLSEDEVKWVQYHLYDLEYTLPVYKEADGSKPRGDAALGINGKLSEELFASVETYLQKRKISRDKFIGDIEYRVTQGIYLDYNEEGEVQS